MAPVFALHGLWLFAAKIAVLPVSGWGVYCFYLWVLDWLGGSGVFEHRLGSIAQDVLRSLTEQPQNWHQLDPFCLAFSSSPITYSHQAPLRLWLRSGERKGLDGTIEHTFSPLENARLRAAVAEWSRGRDYTCVQQTLAGGLDVSMKEDGLDETVRQIIQSFKEHPERWHQFSHHVVYSRYPVSDEIFGKVRLWTANGVHYLEMDGQMHRRFTTDERAAIWSAYASWRERTKALRQRTERLKARSLFR